MSKVKKRRNSIEVETSAIDIFKTLSEVLFGSKDDFDDEVEEVEENEEVHESPKSAQKQVSEPTPVQVQTQAPAQEVFPTQKSEEATEAAIWKTLRADLNRFVQSGQTGESLFRLMEEGFEKNPQLLLQLTELVESRKMEEEVHPGYLMEYQGKQSMFTSKERALKSFFERPGSTIKESIFVSQKRNGKAVSTREATEEEKRRYYERQSSKVDASGQEDQGQ